MHRHPQVCMLFTGEKKSSENWEYRAQLFCHLDTHTQIPARELKGFLLGTDNEHDVLLAQNFEHPNRRVGHHGNFSGYPSQNDFLPVSQGRGRVFSTPTTLSLSVDSHPTESASPTINLCALFSWSPP